MTTNKPNRRWVEHWRTIAVTALPPGWINVYDYDDGTLGTEACPAILLQETRVASESWDATDANGRLYRATREHRHEEPFDTQAVFAAVDETGVLDGADRVANYLGTAAPGQDPESLRPKRPQETP